MKVFLRSVYLTLLSLVCFAEFLHAQTPVADFTATPLAGCSPLVVQFTNTSTGSPTSYQWNLGNGVNTIQQNPSTTYTIPGTYTVTLTVSNANGSDTKTVTNYITVLPDPVVDFAANDTSDCPPFSVQFNNTTNPMVPGTATYSWSFGDGNVSNAANPAHTYNIPGIYNVTLIATNGAGCAATLQKTNYIEVFTPPVADFTATPVNYCGTPASITFSASATGSGPYTYFWDFGDGGTGGGVSITHLYANSGTYTVTLTATDANGCKDTLIKPNYINVGVLTASFTTATPTGCEHAPLQFNNTSVGGNNYFWDFGDGNTSTDANPAHIYTTSGTYSVKLVAYNSPCKDSITIPVTINQAPIANFNYTPNQPCPAPVLIQFNNTTAGAISYAWSFGDGGTSILTSPSHNYASNNYYPVRLVATNLIGCTDTLIDTLKIHSLGVWLSPFTPVKGCAPLSVNFGNGIYGADPSTGAWYTYPYGATSFSWTFGDGGTSNLANPSHVYTTASNVYTATLTVTTANGCTTNSSKAVSVGSKPTASFTDFPDTACVNTPIYFVNTSISPSTYTTFTWDMGNGQQLSSTNALYAYATSGIYNVSLTADDLGCTDVFTADSAAYILSPTSIWTEQYSCDTPLMVKFYDTLSIDPTSHTWYFGDGTTDTSSNPIHTYPALGTYTVSLVTFNSNYGCIDTNTRTIELVDPVLSFITPDTAICKGDSIVFTPNYTHTPNLYRWFIDGQNPPWPFNPLQNPNPSSGPWGHRFNQNGIYDISVVTSDIHGCFDTATRSDYVLVAKPTAAFMASATVGCIPLTVLFTDTSTNTPGAFSVTHSWSFGNGNAAVTTDTVSRLYPASGVYNVQLTVTDNVGCTDVLVKQGYIDARQPHAAFSVDDSNACIGQSLQFSNSSTGVSLNAFWDFGDGTTSNSFTPTKSYTQTGFYTVKLVVSDPTGCTDSLTKVSYITITKPVAAFTLSDTMAICPPLTVQFTDLSANAVSYLWNFGNSSGSALQNPTTIYSSSALYTVSLVVTNVEGCTDTAYAQVDVLGYAGGLDYSPLQGCGPLQVEFKSNLYGVPTIIWDFNDGVTIPLNGIDTTIHTYVTPGAYVPKLILSDNAGCTNSSEGLDTIKVDAVLAGFITSPPCVNTPVDFIDTSFTYFMPVTSWYWDFNNGQQTSTADTPSFTFTSVGTYPVTLIATNAQGCKDTITRSVTIYDLPLVTAAFDTTICKGDATQLTAEGASTYEWTPNTGLGCFNCATTTASPVQTTNYIVAGTDFRGCVNKDTVKITVKYITTSSVADGGGICIDSVFQLNAFGAERYEWFPMETLDDNKIPNPIASPEKTTIYTVLAWEGSCIADTNTVRVEVYSKPTVDAGKDVTIIAGTSVVLIATGTNFENFIWSPAATLSCEVCSAPNASPRSTTTYKVTAVSDKGCKASDSVTVHLLCDNNQVFVPNTFTPNNDGQNDVFYPRGTGMKRVTSFRIYNRWGEMVFEKRGFQLNDITAGWDGTYKGAQLSSDIFIYSIDGICDSGDPLSWKGDVTLIR